jgi:hypothetical protein
MAGLDSIKHFQEGGSSTPTEPTAPLAAKAPKSTGPYALPTPTSVTGVDPSLLENMQKLIAEREAKKNSFMESMRDATAWWSGGVRGPGDALAARAKEREEFDATTFGMKRDLAQNKIAQQQAQNMQRQLFGDTPTPTTTAGAPQTGAQMAGTAPGAPAGTPTTSQGGLLNLVKDPGLRQSIATQATRDQAGAFAAIQSYLAANAKDPDIIKKVNYMLNNGMIDKSLVPQILLTEAVGAGAFNPQDVRGPQGTVQTTPFNTAGTITKAATPAPAAAAPAARPAAAPVVPPAPAPAAAPPVTPPVVPAAAPPVTPPVAAAPVAAPAAKVPVLPHTQPLPKITAPEAAPLVSPTLQTGFAPGSKEDLEAKAAAAKSKIELNAEQEKPIQKGAGESAVSLTNAASKAKDNIQQYDMAESILRQYPKAFGISQDGSVTAMLSQLIGPGVTVPIVGTLKAPGLEEARAQKLGPKALAARATFDSLASRFATDYANQNLTGEGRGTLSNADLKMAGVAKGLSKDVPAASNLIFAILNRENEQMLLERGNAWTQYQKEMRANGYQPDFNRFRETDVYKKAMADKEARIAKRFPEFFAKGTEAPKEGDTGKPSPADFMKKKG